MSHRSIPPKACASPDRRGAAPRLLALAVALTLASPVAGGAADVAWPEAYWNPAPAADDVVLPMPCGGAMAFRKIAIPDQGPLNDYRVQLGEGVEDQGFAEGVRPAYIAGSFQDGAAERYYLLGKYEVNQLQYRALAGGDCPEPSLPMRLPQTEVGWFEAVAAGDAYSRWLRKTAPETLPTDGTEAGFVRLPTETEWEFAARGGTAVSAADFSETTFPMPDGDLAAYVWYAGTESANGRPQFIGLRKPNPLGLYDMLGNVDEMVLEPFRLNRLDRLHGQAGGYIVRGGNYLTPKANIRSADRQEVPYYKGGDARLSKTTGFRFAVVAPVISSRDRLKAIKSAWSALGSAASAEQQKAEEEKSRLSGQPLDDPVKELGVIADAADDDAMKTRLGGVQKQLQTIQASLRARIQERDDQHHLAARASLRLGAFLCQKLSADGGWVDYLEDLAKKREASLGAENERTQKARDELRINRDALDAILQYYADTVLTTVDIYDRAVLEDELAVLDTELKRKGYENLASFAARHHANLVNYRKNQRVARSDWLDACKKVQ